MQEVLDHPLTQYLILIIAVIAGIVAVKTFSAYLPEASILGSVKHVIMAV